jgi:hypothetical protein
MPHVVFDKEIDLESFSTEFKEMMIKEPFLIKLLDVYTNKERRVALVPAVVIDKLHQRFLIEISTRKDKTRGQDVTGFDCKNNSGDES